jgi:hypothetical protein
VGSGLSAAWFCLYLGAREKVPKAAVSFRRTDRRCASRDIYLPDLWKAHLISRRILEESFPDIFRVEMLGHLNFRWNDG